MSLRLREATAEDLPFLLELTERLADFSVPGWRQPRQIIEADHAILRQAVANPAVLGSTIVLAEDPTQGRLGYVFATTRSDYFTGEPCTHVEVLTVAPEAQGRGVAGRLMEEIEARARSRGHRHITLNVFDQNIRARGLYQHLGYRPETVHYLKPL